MTELSAFHDVRFPIALALDASGGPEWRNEVIGMLSGREKRNARQSASRRRYDVGTGLRSLEDIHALVAFFEARRGTLHAFRLQDPFDWKSCAIGATPGAGDQPIGVGDGVKRRFALSKTYGAGDDAFARPIRLPQSGTLLVAVNGVALTGGQFSFYQMAGEVEIAAPQTPANGAAVTAGYAFDVAVRFDVEHLALNLAAFKAGQAPSIPLIEVLL
jgi:uncharacterized protein (TIGR02217 family)